MSFELGGYLKRKLEEQNLSQIEFANKIGLSASMVSRLITGYRGTKRPSIETLQKIAKGLNVSTQEIVNHSGWIFEDLPPEQKQSNTTPDLKEILMNTEVMFDGQEYPLTDTQRNIIGNVIKTVLDENKKS